MADFDDLPPPGFSDSEEYTFDDLPPPGFSDTEEDSPAWYDYPKELGRSVLGSVGSKAAYVGEAASDLIGAEGLEKFFSDTVDIGQQQQQIAKENLNFEEGSWGAFGMDVATGATEIGGLIAAAPVALPAALGGAALGAYGTAAATVAPYAAAEAARKYVDVRDHGGDKTEASMYGTASGALTQLIGTLPIGEALKSGKAFLPKILATMGLEGTEEAVEETWDVISESMYRGDIESASSHLANSLGRIGRAAGVGAATAGLYTPLAHRKGESVASKQVKESDSLTHKFENDSQEQVITDHPSIESPEVSGEIDTGKTKLTTTDIPILDVNPTPEEVYIQRIKKAKESFEPSNDITVEKSSARTEAISHKLKVLAAGVDPDATVSAIIDPTTNKPFRYKEADAELVKPYTVKGTPRKSLTDAEVKILDELAVEEAARVRKEEVQLDNTKKIHKLKDETFAEFFTDVKDIGKKREVTLKKRESFKEDNISKYAPPESTRVEDPFTNDPLYQKYGDRVYNQLKDLQEKKTTKTPHILDPRDEIVESIAPKIEAFENLSTSEKTTAPDEATTYTDFKGESGFINPAVIGADLVNALFTEGKKAGKSAYEMMYFLGTGNHIGIAPLPDAAKFLEGGGFRDTKYAGSLLSSYRKGFAYMRTLRKKSSEGDIRYSKVERAFDEVEMSVERNSRKLKEIADPMLEVSETDGRTLFPFLAADRHMSVRALKNKVVQPEWTDAELIAKGLPQHLIPSYRAARNWANSSLDLLHETLKTEARNVPAEHREAYEAQLEQAIKTYKLSKYIPFDREGKYVLKVKDKNKELLERSQYRTAAEAKAIEAIRKKNKNVTTSIEEMTKSERNVYADTPIQVNDLKAMFDPQTWLNNQLSGSNKGLSARLLSATLVPGYDMDFKTSISKYTTQLVRRHAIAKMEETINPMFKKAGDTTYNKDEHFMADGNNSEAKFIQDIMSDMKNPGSDVSILQRLGNTWFLGGVASSGLLQIVEGAQKTLPYTWQQLTDHNKAKGKKWSYSKGLSEAMNIQAKVARDAGVYFDGVSSGIVGNLTKKVTQGKLAKSNPELYKFLSRAELNGLLGAKTIHELSGWVSNPLGKKPWDQYAMGFIALGEKTQRLHAILSLYHIGKHKGLKGESLFDYAVDQLPEIVTSNQAHRQSAWMRSKIGEFPAGKLASMYKNYTGHYLRFLRDRSAPKDWPFLLSSLLISGLAGGSMSILGVKTINSIMNMWDEDLRPTIRRATSPKTGQALVRGLPSLGGVSLAGSLGSPEVFDTDTSLAEMAGTVALGPLGNLLAKGADAGILAKEGDYWKATMQAAPRTIRNIMKSVDIKTPPPKGSLLESAGAKTSLTDRSGAPIPIDPTWKNVITTLSGLAPEQSSMHYEKQNVQQMYSTNTRGREDRVMREVMRNFMTGKEDKAIDIMRDKGVGSYESVRSRADTIMNKDKMRIRRAPKSVKRKMAESLSEYENWTNKLSN